MSLTFGITGFQFETGTDIPCKECGVSLMESSTLRATDTLKAAAHAACKTCSGYGGPPEEDLPQTPFLLNVATAAGSVMLSLLEEGMVEEDQIDPASILTFQEAELAEELARLYKARGLYNTSLPLNVFHTLGASRGLDVVASHHASRLRKIAAKAKQYGRTVWFH